MGPDPYRDWLAIETDYETPNHYELLGIAPFTDDATAIRQAYEDRYALVRRYEVGNYGERALALMAELSEAFKCLTNASRKSQYDGELREILASRQTKVVGGASRDTMHDTVVDQISELEEIVDAEWPEGDPLGAGPLTNSVDFAGSSIPAASSYLHSPATGGPLVENAKTEIAIPIWIAALGVSGIALLAIGAMALAFVVLGSRDKPDPLARVPIAPPSANDRDVDSELVTEAIESVDADDVTGLVEWSGRLAKVLRDEDGTSHLLIASSDRIFEATSSDPDWPGRLAEYVCLAEDASRASEVKVTGTVMDRAVNFFGPSGDTPEDQDELAVVELQNLEVVKNNGSGESELSSSDKAAVSSLRGIGHYTQFIATATSSVDDASQRFQVSFCGREYLVELPAAWRAVGLPVSQGDQLSLVTRTTGAYGPPTKRPGIISRILFPGSNVGDGQMLVLQAETVNQPAFEQVDKSPTQFVGQKLTYQARLLSSLLKDNTASLTLGVQHAGKQFSIKGLAGVESDQGSSLRALDGRHPLLVEFEVANTEVPLKYQVASLTHLNDPMKRIVFDAITETTPNPMPLVGRSDPKPPPPEPASRLALANLPNYIDLPPVASQASKTLIQATELAELEIELASDLITLDPAYAFVAKQVDSSAAPRWDIYLQKTLDVGTHEKVVAHLGVDREGLVFRWTDDAGELPVGQLRNCLMQLAMGGQTHQMALRAPEKSGATRLPPEADKFQLTFDLGDLPRSESLSMDVQLTYGGSIVQPQGGSETATRGKRLDFPIEGLDDVEIQIALLTQRDSSLTLQVMPRYRLGPSRQMTLSTEDVNDQEQRIRQAIVSAQRGIIAANNDLQTARNGLARASNSATRVRMGAIVANKNKAIISKQKSLRESQQSLGTLGNLRGLVSAVRSNTLIHYRIYAEANGTRVLLVDGAYADKVALQESTSGSTGGLTVIDGVWQPIRLEIQQRPIQLPVSYQIQFAGGRFTTRSGSSVIPGTYRIDTSTTPPQIAFDEASVLPLRKFGIIQTSGIFKTTSNPDELLIAFSTDGSPPRDFGSRAKSNTVVTVYRRVE